MSFLGKQDSALATANAARQGTFQTYWLRALERRKPKLLYTLDGLLAPGKDEVQSEALLPQQPPRNTLSDPEEEPFGSVP